MGSLACLNVSGGDIKISFDTNDAAEAIRAKRMIVDMLKRGYALLIEVNGKFTRCLEFKEDVGEYIVADFDPVIADEVDKNDSLERNEKTTEGAPDSGQSEDLANTKKTRGRPSKSKTVAIPMAQAKARAVAPSSGG